MYRLLVLIPLLLTVSAFAGPAGEAALAPVWPLPLETRYLTSNFMEHRAGRFHAGLDLKTEGRTGFPVLAVEDGWVARIRVSPAGYGKVLYLRGVSGRTYVYAHLERIGDRWRPLVRRTQARRGRYDVTLHFPAGKHEVVRGEVLALSGQSGTAGPHLHFEVRDAENRPLDPLAYGFAVHDTIPPAILKIRAMPASPRSRIEGGVIARSIAGDPLSGELPLLQVAGEVAFTAQVRETADIRGYRLEPYRLALSLDDSLVFETRNEVYDFAHQHQMRLEWLEQPGWRERWLYRRDGDVLPSRTGGDWSLDPAVLAPGRHEVRVVVEDRAGNVSAVHWTLEVSAEAPGAPPRAASAWEADPVRIEVSDGPDGSRRWLTPFIAGDGDRLAAVAMPPGGWLEGGAEVLVPGTLSDDARRSARRVQGLEFATWCARVAAPDWTARGGVDFALAVELPDTLPAALGLYVQNPRNGWSYAGKPRRLGEDWVFDAHGPGRYALFFDRTPPYLGPGPAEGIVGPAAPSPTAAVTAPAWEVVAIRLEDLGAGVDTASLTVTLDASPLIVEPDPPRDRLLVELPDVTLAGPHRLEIRVADHAGHVTERSYGLTLVVPTAAD